MAASGTVGTDRPAVLPQIRPVEKRRGLRQALRRFTRRRVVLIGVVLVAFELLFAIFGPLLIPYEPQRQDLFHTLAPPSPEHLLGTDDLGRDILSRLAHGSRISLTIGLSAVFAAGIPGVLLGLLVGYKGGTLDNVVMRVTDSVMAFPSIVLTLTIVAVLGQGIFNLIIAIGVAGWPNYARLTRGQVLAVREYDYVLAVRTVGATQTRIMLRHVLPNAINPAIVAMSLGVGFAIVAESGLSFLGLGVLPPTPTWGSMIQTGFQVLEIAPGLVMAPGVMIFLAVLGFNLLGDGLREALDPYLK
ncbi:MAG TPA: ABC transporter permease [Candidatus Limnocylindria bacterium]|nr:ABC transporter permease [Candidatus Limnocylindria bacterium]